MSLLEENFCKLLDAYFNALVRGGTQTEIDEARLAIIAEYRLLVLYLKRAAGQSPAEQP